MGPPPNTAARSAARAWPGELGEPGRACTWLRPLAVCTAPRFFRLFVEEASFLDISIAALRCQAAVSPAGGHSQGSCLPDLLRCQ